MKEQWHPVVGWESLYSVSNLGRVRRESQPHCGRGSRIDRDGRIVNGETTVYGYRRVILSNGTRRARMSIHSLVLAAFVGRRPRGATINHRNGRKSDNRLINIEYCTHKENIRHSIEFLGNDRTGERHPSAILTESQVREIHARYANGEPREAIAQRYKVSPQTVHAIAGGHSWGHLGLAKLRRHKTSTTIPIDSLRAIRDAIASGRETQVDIARRFGVAQCTISDIKTGRRWSGVS